ncbi:MAG: DUF5677 domain-containing protein [Candidatus Omnitrophota bacterium]
MSQEQKFHLGEYQELFDFSDDINQFTSSLLNEFNGRKIKLFDLPAYQRIFLFIVTRSIKTFASILVLCKAGYGQDVSTLLRSLLENLVTAKYIIHDPDTADEKARRFVAYKWVIFKRQLPEQEKMAKTASVEQKNELLERKHKIQKKVDEFKNNFNIISDKALITWSGKSIRDMAKKVDHKLLDEYEKTFRLCSRFSHPSILGDNEYLIQDDKNLIFSPLPSDIGIVTNLVSAIKYEMEFLNVTNHLFKLNKQAEIVKFTTNYDTLFNNVKYSEDALAKKSAQTPSSMLRESTVTFKTDL